MEKWKKAHASDVEHWFDTLGDFEALNSLATIHFNNPGWCFPALHDKHFFMKAKELDQKFDNGDDILDLSGAKRVTQNLIRVDVDFPVWMFELLDKEANRIGVTRQSIIKVWLAERLEQLSANKALHRTSR
jgi:hypothetical protein